MTLLHVECYVVRLLRCAWALPLGVCTRDVRRARTLTYGLRKIRNVCVVFCLFVCFRSCVNTEIVTDAAPLHANVCY